MGQQRIDQCINEEYSVTLGLTADGKLMLSGQDGRWENVNFCENYAGYYPACDFTAIICKEGTFYAAGIDAEGKPHLFASLMGHVWNETKLIDFHAKSQASGKIVRILYDEEDDQMYLICDNGDLITVPDCVRCIRIRRMTEKQVIDGQLQERDIILCCRDGGQIRVPMSVARQYRASAEYIIEQFMENGGYLVDFRHGQTGISEGVLQRDLPEALCKAIKNGVGVYVSIEFEELRDWLDGIPKSAVAAFVCESGVLSDEAALYARRQGWRKTYSCGIF